MTCVYRDVLLGCLQYPVRPPGMAYASRLDEKAAPSARTHEGESYRAMHFQSYGRHLAESDLDPRVELAFWPFALCTAFRSLSPPWRPQTQPVYGREYRRLAEPQTVASSNESINRATCPFTFSCLAPDQTPKILSTGHSRRSTSTLSSAYHSDSASAR